MCREKTLIETFIRREEKLSDQVKHRDWKKIEGHVDRMDRAAQEIEKVETERHSGYQKIRDIYSISDDRGFRSCISHAPEIMRQELSDLYSELRLALVRIRSLSRGLFYTFQGIQEYLDRILAEVYPHRRGRIYSSRGSTRDGADNPVVINQTR